MSKGFRGLFATAAAVAALAAFALPGRILAQAPAPAATAAGVSVAGVSAAPTAAPAIPAAITVAVQLTNGTAGGSTPAKAAITLYGFDGSTQAFTREATADATGAARFENVPFTAGRAFGATAQVGRTVYSTELTPAKAGETELKLGIKVYDTTTDAKNVQVDQMLVVAEVVDGNKADIINAYTLSNTGDRTVEGVQATPDGKLGSLRFDLPTGAANVQFQADDGQSFITMERGFLYTRGLQPGTAVAQVAVRYTIPYSGSLHIEPAVHYAVEKVSVLIADQGLTLRGAQLKEAGERKRQDGAVFREYSAEPLKGAAPVAFDLSGTPQQVSKAPAAEAAPQAEAAAQSPGAQPPAGDGGLQEKVAELLATLNGRARVGILLLLAGLVVILVAGGLWLGRLRAARWAERLAGNPGARQQALVRAVVDLEEDYEGGLIDDGEYLERRGVLEAALDSA